MSKIKNPNNWLVCKMQEIASIYNGNSISEEVKARDFTGLATGYNYIATKDVGFDSIINYENGVKIPFTRKDFKIAPKNTPLLCIEGGSAGRKLGFLSEDVCFGNKLCAFVSPFSQWIYYYLQSHLFRNHFNTNKNGLIGGVSINKLKQISTPLPPLAEQKRIVKKIEGLFGVIDEQVKRLETAQDALISYRQSILNTYFKNSKYSTCKIKDLCQVVRGGSPRPAGDPRFYNGTIPFLKVADLTHNSSMFVNEATYTIKPAGLIKTRKVPANTLLLSNSGATLGVPKICTFETTFNDGIAAFLNLPKEALPYHYYFWVSKTKELRAINQGAAQPNLNTTIIENMDIPYPSLSEQKTIVKKIESAFAFADKAQAAITDALEQAKQLKQSILKRAFEGKLVPQDPNDKPIDLTQLKKDKQK